jgi:hypothetical protein
MNGTPEDLVHLFTLIKLKKAYKNLNGKGINAS